MLELSEEYNAYMAATGAVPKTLKTFLGLKMLQTQIDVGTSNNPNNYYFFLNQKAVNEEG